MDEAHAGCVEYPAPVMMASTSALLSTSEFLDWSVESLHVPPRAVHADVQSSFEVPRTPPIIHPELASAQAKCTRISQQMVQECGGGTFDMGPAREN